MVQDDISTTTTDDARKLCECVCDPQKLIKSHNSDLYFDQNYAPFCTLKNLVKFFLVQDDIPTTTTDIAFKLRTNVWFYKTRLTHQVS